MENGAFAPVEQMLHFQRSKCSIFHNIFKSIQNLIKLFMNFFPSLKIENDVMI